MNKERMRYLEKDLLIWVWNGNIDNAPGGITKFQLSGKTSAMNKKRQYVCGYMQAMHIKSTALESNQCEKKYNLNSGAKFKLRI